MVVQAIKTRTTGGCFEASLAAVLTALGVGRNDACDCARVDASLEQAMTFDTAKDQQSIIRDASSTLVENLGGAEANLRRLVLHQTLYALVRTTTVNSFAAEVCEAFLYSGLIFTRLM